MNTESRDVIIFDTTLRDGEQAPGCSMTIDEKIHVARQLKRLGVNAMEAGFPVVSEGDFRSVREVAAAVQGVIVAGLARCVSKDIERAAEALEPASHPRIHVFLATSEVHRRHKLRKAQSEILKLATQGVKEAKSCCSDVEFSPEDASRTEPEFLSDVVQAVIEAGASTVNIPDTVGYAIPRQFGEIIAMLVESVPNINDAVLSVHCHNDLGLAVSNSLEAVRNGARQVECTVNGIGERAGNCALEELVMALKVRHDVFGLETSIDTRQIMPTSRLVSSVTGMMVQHNKAVVGENAFAHEAGIHQDGMIKERTTYEIMAPEDVGAEKSRLVLGKHSGRHALKKRLIELGIELHEEQLERVFSEFKTLSDKKKQIYDEDIEAIVREEIEAGEGGEPVAELLNFHISSGTGSVPTATVHLGIGDEQITDAATGDGPVDAIYRTIDRITGLECTLRDYNIRAVTGGKDAMGEVNVLIEAGRFSERGRATSTDIVEASLRAYLTAVNRILRKKENDRRKR